MTGKMEKNSAAASTRSIGVSSITLSEARPTATGRISGDVTRVTANRYSFQA